MLDIITEHLDVWASAQEQKKNGGRGRGKSTNGDTVYGIKKLRELILELAVRGKLVPQDPNDEPASMLLEQIAEEKKRLIKEGKIKKQKKLPAIGEDEKPFDLPDGWEWAHVGHCFSLMSGTSFNKEKELKKGDFIYLKVGDMNLDGNEIEITTSSRFLNPTQKDLRALIPPRSIIFPKRGGAIATNKKRFVRNQLFVDLNIMAITPFDGIDLNYSYLWLLNIDLAQLNSGTSVPQINNKDISPLLFPIPPLPEQHRIVAKVDELMALCDKLEQQQIDSNATHQTLVETLLTSPTNSADQTEFNDTWQRIAEHFDTLFTTEQSIDLLEKIILELAVKGFFVKFDDRVKNYLVKDLLSFGPRNGLSPKEASFDTKVKVFKLGATTKGYLDLSESKYVDVEISKDSHLWVNKGDLLLQRGNAADHVGCNVLIDQIPPGYIYPDLMMKIRVNETVLPEYLSLCLSSSSSRQFMWDRMTGTSGTMPKISKKVVENIPIELPNLEKQAKIVSLVAKLLQMTKMLRQGLYELSINRANIADAIVMQAVNQ